MHKHLLFLFLLLVILCFRNSNAQTLRQFNTDPLLFTDEIIQYMGENLTYEQTVEVDRFTTLWDSSAFNMAEMQAIVNTSNLLLARNARPVPHMLNYLVLLNSFSKHDPGHRHYAIWQEAFTGILHSNDLSMQNINALMMRIGTLVSRNVLYSSIAVNWEASSADYTFVYNDSLRIAFSEVNLTGYNHIDTLAIFRTSGTFCPVSLIWEGKGGRVTWERAGLDAREAYAMLGAYTIYLNSPEYKADSVLFSFNRYFDSPISGLLTDRVMSTGSSDNSVYPGFISDRQEFVIKNIYPGIDYEGGLSMKGSTMIGSGGEQGNARLIFYREGKTSLKAGSRHFVFKDQGVSSLSTSIVFYLENDSVFHPDLQLNYVDFSRELSLNQNDKVISKSPWDNQFHQVEMTFARLLWKVDEEEMKLTMPRASLIGNASFKSLGFFDRNHYNQLQGMDRNHPLLSLRKLADTYESDEFPAEEYAKSLRMPLSRVRHQLLDLSLDGFIFYDTDTDLILPRQKLFDYLQANIRRIDYDIIDFSSTTQAPLENALLNLATHDLQINGIPRVHISNTHNVNIFPGGNTVTMKRNRNFMFEGIINAGNLSFFGTNFTFDYERFSISLQNVDSLSMRARLDETDAYGRARLTGVRNLIRNVTGELIIDSPFNKSGRVDQPEYPKFKSNENSYVFYDNPEIQNGAYKQEEFYFELYPFVMDSLNTFGNSEFNFNGRLISAGIFPVIEESLTLQEDYSLGIKHTVGGGLPVYGGKGTFYREIQLSNSGLRGSGQLDYLASELYSEDFLFLPESMTTVTNDFFVVKQVTGTEFPAASSRNNTIQWLPDKDVMTVMQNDDPFSMFDDQAMLNGSLNITPSGLSGAGIINLDRAEISSDSYTFSSESFKSAESKLAFRNPENKDNTLTAGNLDCFIDLDARRGEFSTYPDNSMVFLPVNGYAADPESFAWDMDNSRFEFVSSRTNPENGLQGAEYISTVQGQDSLSFFSPRTVLDYDSHLLTAHEVNYIEIADARIFPAGESIIIGESADIFPLREASLKAGPDRSPHEIYNAGIKITSKNKFSGSGDYDYIDALDEIQTIHFSDITVDDDNQTIARGKKEESDNFMLSPAFAFYGGIEMKASNPHLNFRGATRIMHECEGLSDQWLAFENITDPADIMIPVPVRAVSDEREPIYSGIFVATDSVHIYPAFMSGRKNYADRLLVETEGYMKYDENTGEYIIASAEKLRNPELPGNYLRLNPQECLLQTGGKLNLGVTLGQIELTGIGSAINRINKNETNIGAVLSLDFFFSDEALSLIAHDADSLPGTPADSAVYLYDGGLSELLGRERAGQFTAARPGGGRQGRLPEELQKTFVLSHVDLNWNRDSRSYVSSGKIGIAYINGVEINKFFNGYLEITKRRSGDYMDLYIEFDNNRWYYFGYTRGVMQAFSSNRDFVTIIDDLALRHRRARGDSDQERYIYMLATDTKIEQFFQTYSRHLETTDVHSTEDEGGPDS